MSGEKTKLGLDKYYYPAIDSPYIEIGIDEVGRGPLFGRVYSACVVLPKKDANDGSQPNFNFDLLKDSKKFTSRKKIKEAAEYIKQNVPFYSIGYEDEKTIDMINIKQASFSAMHRSIKSIIESINSGSESGSEYKEKRPESNYVLLVDGNDFKPYTYCQDSGFKHIPHISIVGGDNLYCSIAAASILAKVAHDEYIDQLCQEYPKLDTYYDLVKNKGYGTAKHREGILKYGASPFHRMSFSTCSACHINPVDFYK